MTTILIIHGTGGSPESNWFPWLKTGLEELGCDVLVPRFPSPEQQSLSSWLAAFRPYEKELGEDTILVGHSIGAAFILNILEKTDTRIKAAFLVSGFTGPLHNDFDKYNRTIAEKEFDRERIRKHCKRFVVINSDSDPYVPLAKGKDLAKHLGTKLIILPDAGHINAEAGFTELPMLLELMKKEM